MAVTLIFTPDSMSAEQYDEAIKRLEEAGQGMPAGRLHHVAFRDGDKVKVVDVWDSEESFQRFGETLIPILQELGVDPGEPAVGEVHNVIVG